MNFIKSISIKLRKIIKNVNLQFRLIVQFVFNAILIIINSIKYITQLIKTTFKSYVKLMIKLLCFSVLFYSVIEVTKEYFSYPYVYRLIVKPSEGLHLPPISVCTERDVLFDKTRIIDYFNISQDYESYTLDLMQKTIQLENECITNNEKE